MTKTSVLFDKNVPLSMFDLSKIFTFPKILIQKIFDFSKISRGLVFNLSMQEGQLLIQKHSNLKNFDLKIKMHKHYVWRPILIFWRQF
jgi:hypothetical protein